MKTAPGIKRHAMHASTKAIRLLSPTFGVKKPLLFKAFLPNSKEEILNNLQNERFLVLKVLIQTHFPVPRPNLFPFQFPFLNFFAPAAVVESIVIT